ncbi:MAG: histidine kinase, partial [Bacteroidota bacterium]
MLSRSTSSLTGKEDSSRKQKLNALLPIALALLLPGLSLYTNKRITFPSDTLFYTIWGFSSFFFYNLWYLLWSLWELKRKYRHRTYLFRLVIYCLGMIGSFLLIFHYGQLFYVYHLSRIISITVLCLVIQYMLKTQENIAQLQLEKEQIETENYKVQLKILQAKIDPHFLFNSLNTLRAMVRQGYSKSEKFILNLS